MSRRSQTNARYRKDAQVGKTRRSASSLRTKRAGASSSGGGAKKKAAGRGSRPRSAFKRPPYMDTPEWRTASRYNWIALGIAIAAAFALMAPRYIGAIRSLETNRLYFSVLSGIWFGGLGVSVYIQFVVLRRIRREYESKGKPAAKAEPKSGEKGPDKGGKDS